MLRRRLLATGGGGPYRLLAPAAVRTLLSSGGLWQSISAPSAQHHAGYTYFGWSNVQTGDVSVAAYEHASGTVTVQVIHAGFSTDGHSSPAVLIPEPDHHLVVAWTGHDSANAYRRVSVNSLDSDPTMSGGFGSEAAILSASDYTYVSLVQLNGVAGAPCYLFARAMFGSSYGRLARSVSTDQGATWASADIVLTGSPSDVPYWHITTDWDTRIDIAVTDTDRSPGNPSSTYHMYLVGSTLYKTDGTSIASSGSWPVAPSTGTLIKDDSEGPTFPEDVLLDGSGHPAIVFRVLHSGATTNSQRVARWTGSAWHTDVVADTDGLQGAGYDNTGACFDDALGPDGVYMGRIVSGQSEMFRYTTPDGGATWSPLQLTSGSAYNNVRPQRVDRSAAGLRTIWAYGPPPDGPFDIIGYG